MAIKCKLQSSLVKVFNDCEPISINEEKFEGFFNETISFQLAYTDDGDDPNYLAQVVAESPIKDYIRLRRVNLIPVLSAINPPPDDNYLRTAPGLYPDRLS